MSDAPTFDRDATKEALEAPIGVNEEAGWAEMHSDDLWAIFAAARWALAVTEGDGELWAYVGGARRRVWPPEAE